MVYPKLNELSERMNIGGEVWRDVSGWEGIYEVSNRGRVKRLKRRVTHRNQATAFSMVYPTKILKANPDSKGYPQVVLNAVSAGKKKRTARVHRLVAESFLPNPQNKPQVNHINLDTMDARAFNLEWCTAGENIKHSWDAGIRDKKLGEDSHVVKYTNRIVREVYTLSLSRLMSQQKIGEAYGMPQITVSNIKTKKTWKHITDLIDKEVH
tara:strand:+ start:124 stop:753 length:630 start_codon:yes stop_codon:yes gene_type:complete